MHSHRNAQVVSPPAAVVSFPDGGGVSYGMHRARWPHTLTLCQLRRPGVAEVESWVSSPAEQPMSLRTLPHDSAGTSSSLLAPELFAQERSPLEFGAVEARARCGREQHDVWADVW